MNRQNYYTQRKQQPPQQQPRHDYGEMPVGEILRRTRVYYGLSLEQLQAALCIRMAYLEAIENGDLGSLPGRTYAIGFVRTYAEYLQLDAEQVVRLFKNQYVGNNNRPELYFPAAASESKLPNRYIVASSLAALVALVVGWSVIGGSDDSPAKRGVPAVPENLKIEIAARKEALPLLDAVVLNAIEPAVGDMTGENEDQAGPSSVRNDIAIHMKDSVWIEIRREEDGHIHVSQVFREGDYYELPAEEGLVMDTGNAGALEIHIGERVLPRLGETGDVMRAVSLAPASLMQKFAPESDTISPDDLSGTAVSAE